MFSVFDADSVKHFRPKPLQKHLEKVAHGPFFGPSGAYSLRLVKDLADLPAKDLSIAWISRSR